MTRILLADDHEVVRQGFHRLLSEQPDFTVVGEAGDGATALRLVEELRPDVLVLDLVMPGLNGLEILKDIGRCSPLTRVVVLSMYDDRGYVLRALHGGALAYLLKESSGHDLIQAVRFALQGRHYLSAPLVEYVVAVCLESPHPGSAAPDESLSAREREVLQLLGTGQTNTEIAASLGVSADTVETFCRRLRGKLEFHSQSDLRHYALQHHHSL
jgi:two-component system, NarL family, response regulator NreC